MKRSLILMTALAAIGAGAVSVVVDAETSQTPATAMTVSAADIEQQAQTRFCYGQYRDQTDIANCLRYVVR
jgi:hypothetical protein